MNEQDVINAFYNYYKEFSYEILEIKFIFTLGGSYDINVLYKNNENIKETILDGRELFKYERYIYNLFISKIETNDKFNIVIYKIKNDGTHSSVYLWENEKSHQDLLDYAEVFYQWVNERMMSMIFEYEKDNDLVPTEYDSDGDLEYLSSWDSGVFTFHIDKNNNLVYKVVLTKDGKERTLDLPLRDYFVEGILDHYKVTNNELSDDWKPWNTMILKSLHYDIPYDKREEFVNYILE
ncbi:hypothetical protein [Flavobacterium sp. F52]|uniref:hypothetical protein n=1 Tax=Flavobacterium sp. F52 TaxID=1202532 RepID=UPI00027308B7|nr:hypothetical protein [Flavobacterium sp. F52]EJG03053.1 hypothetical protein FF52_02635 [Flavobacterium sp. F52]